MDIKTSFHLKKKNNNSEDFDGRAVMTGATGAATGQWSGMTFFGVAGLRQEAKWGPRLGERARRSYRERARRS